MTIEGVQNPAFKGVYKVTLPNVKSIEDEKEKAAATEAVLNTVVMGSNMSVAEPKVVPGSDLVITYFKVDNKNDEKFENGFKNIVDNCNKAFNTDLAQKVYMEKVSEDDYNNLA